MQILCRHLYDRSLIVVITGAYQSTHVFLTIAVLRLGLRWDIEEAMGGGQALGREMS